MATGFRYSVWVTEGAGQPANHRISVNGRRSAERAAKRMASDGFIGGHVDVVDNWAKNPDDSIIGRFDRKAVR